MDNCEKNLISGLDVLGEKTPKSSYSLTFSILKEFIFQILILIFPDRIINNLDNSYNSKVYEEIVNIYYQLGYGYIFKDLKKFYRVILRVFNIASLKLPDTEEQAKSFFAFSITCSFIGIHKLSDYYLEKCYRIRQNNQNKWGVAQVLELRGFLGFWKGDFKNSMEKLREAYDSFMIIGDPSQAGISIENAILYSSLKKYYEELECAKNQIEQWNKTLEKSVKERTKELELANVELAGKNIVLLEMYKKLNDYNKVVEELAVTRERNRIARDLHDTIGHSMTLMLTHLEVGKMVYSENPEQTVHKIEETIQIARRSLFEIRKTIKGMAEGDNQAYDLVHDIKILIKEFEASGVNVDLSIIGKPKTTNIHRETIFRICQESLTNSLRHGKADNVTIIIRFNVTNVEIFCIDDGMGCSNIVKGMGLSGMAKRVSDLNGKIELGSNDGSGFNIVVNIPIE